MVPILHIILPQPHETVQKDYSASNTRTADNDAQFIPIYAKLDETLGNLVNGVQGTSPPVFIVGGIVVTLGK